MLAGNDIRRVIRYADGDLARARHHDGERSPFGATDTAADGAVEGGDVALRKTVVNPYRRSATHGGQVDVSLDA